MQKAKPNDLRSMQKAFPLGFATAEKKDMSLNNNKSGLLDRLHVFARREKLYLLCSPANFKVNYIFSYLLKVVGLILP